MPSQIANAKVVTAYERNANVNQMDVVKFGSYVQSSVNAQEAIEWLVLEKQDNRALALFFLSLNDNPMGK